MPTVHARASTLPPRCSTAELLEALEDPRRLLVDARAAERFAGTVEPLDPVAGHVPGAVNHPFSANLSPDGRFLPPAELDAAGCERLAARAPAEAIAMCGSGVTACHNLLALEIGGTAAAPSSTRVMERVDPRPRAAGGTRRVTRSPAAPTIAIGDDRHLHAAPICYGART